MLDLRQNIVGETKAYLSPGCRCYIEGRSVFNAKKVTATNLITTFAARWAVDWRMLLFRIANA
jgi:hypothetical protein